MTEVPAKSRHSTEDKKHLKDLGHKNEPNRQAFH
jgi:hypothetical protein